MSDTETIKALQVENAKLRVNKAALIELVKGWEELHAQMATQMQMVEQQRDTLIADNARLISLLEAAQ